VSQGRHIALTSGKSSSGHSAPQVVENLQTVAFGGSAVPFEPAARDMPISRD
jgi:hypothetical protein